MDENGQPREHTRPTALTAMMRFVAAYRRTFASQVAQHSWSDEPCAKAPTYGILTVIDRLGPLSQRQVSDVLTMHPSDLVDHMDALEQQGWVERRRDPADRRRYQLTLTDAGEAALARYHEVALETENIMFEPLSAEQRAQLVELISVVAAARLNISPRENLPHKTRTRSSLG